MRSTLVPSHLHVVLEPREVEEGEEKGEGVDLEKDRKHNG